MENAGGCFPPPSPKFPSFEDADADFKGRVDCFDAVGSADAVSVRVSFWSVFVEMLNFFVEVEGEERRRDTVPTEIVFDSVDDYRHWKDWFLCDGCHRLK